MGSLELLWLMRGCECDFIVLKRAVCFFIFFFQAEDGIRDTSVTGVQTCALPIWFQWFSVKELKVPMVPYLEMGVSNGFLFGN